MSDDEQSIGRPISRRGALITISAAFLAACAPKVLNLPPGETSAALPKKTNAPTDTPVVQEVTATPSALQSPETEQDEFGFQDIEFVDIEGRTDKMKVLGWDRPLTSDQAQRYIETRKPEDLPPPNIRTSTVFVGSDALKEWQNGNRMDRENGLSFIKRHFVTVMEDILARSYPDSGVNNIRMEAPGHETKVVVVDEDWLREYSDGNLVSYDTPADTYAQYFLLSDYNPNPQEYGFVREVNGEKVDFGLLHEQLHYSLYLMPHLFEYFLRYKSWNENLRLPDAVSADQILMRLYKTMQTRFRTEGLQYSGDFYDTYGPLLSRPEELYLRRVLLGGERYTSSLESNKKFWESRCFDTGEFADKYKISGLKDAASASLYVAEVGDFKASDETEWVFDNPPISLEVKDGTVTLPKDQLVGGAVSHKDHSTVLPWTKAFLLVFDGKDGKKVLGFTSYHLTAANYEAQLMDGDKLGPDGKREEITWYVNDFLE